MRAVLSLLLCLFLVEATYSQVDFIKNASSKSGGGSRRADSGSGSGGFVADLFFNIFLGELIHGQQQKLTRKADIPSVVSAELMLQTALQPADYYIIHPRIRGNWGLFSTDFRLNYLVEQDVDGFKTLQTTDWQILQFNFITTRTVRARVGGGMLSSRSFEAQQSYGEWTLGLQVMPPTSRLGVSAEYRGSVARNEWNAQVEYKCFDVRSLHGYLTAGFVHQRYFDAVNVWGVQAGMALRVF